MGRDVAGADRCCTATPGNDRNPIHADREVAWKAGYREPILMGQNTMGFACRALVHELGDGDPARLRSISGRFAAAGYNGDILVTEMWYGNDIGATNGATTWCCSGCSTSDARCSSIAAEPRSLPERRCSTNHSSGR